MAASERYRANAVHRVALGGGYRDLWEAELELPLLDLATEAGGITPTRRFGGLQTAVLGFVNGEGRAFTFRGTDKDPSAVLHRELHDTIVQTLVQDQMAAQHPGAALASAVISEAAGVLTVHERMVVMPDDPALGEFREEFAGMVGTFYEYPLPAGDGRTGFHGATEIIDHEELYERLRRGYDDLVAREAFLRARLVDLLLGDFDRHRKQWRWARLPGDPHWQPIPEDRDQAFVRYEGVPRAASLYVPILQQYGPTYPWMKGLTLHGWEQDRWLLPALSWDTWERIASDVRARVDDDVIDAAVAALPEPYQELDGERLRHDLRGRRDRLVEGARSFYEHLAGQVDVQGRDAAEAVTVRRQEDGSTLVEVRQIGAAESDAPEFSRRFLASETEEVRVYLRAGADRVTVHGRPACSVLPGLPRCTTLRLIAGGGRKAIDDRAGGGTRIYDADGATEVLRGPGTSVDRDVYVPPPSDSGFVDVEDVPPRDWGWDLVPIPTFSYQKDMGVLVGAGALYTSYGFRKHPWSSRHQLTAGWATEASRARVRYAGRYRTENSTLIGTLDLLYSGIEVLRFYGFGNETNADGSDSFFRVRTGQLLVAPGLELAFHDDRIRLSAGPWLQWFDTKDGERLIDQLDPYGAGSFGLMGAFANVKLDWRRSLEDLDEGLVIPMHENPAAGNPTSGFLLDVTAELSPPVWDVVSTWGALEGALSGYLSFGDDGRATLAARVGGRGTFGRQPYFASAFIGGGDFFAGGASVRGLRAQRFAGDASVYGNLDLRVFLARLKVIVPTDIGVLGFGDVGRVFEDGESSDDWHPGAGGGVWLAPLARTNTLSFTIGRSEEETLFYMMFGFLF